MPSFSYQKTSSSSEDERTSISPSSSKSLAKTEDGDFAFTEIVCSIKLLFPLFSYQAILSSYLEEDRISILPSLLISIAYIEFAPSALLEIVWVSKTLFPLFSYHLILSPL